MHSAITVLVTRPEPKGKALCEFLEMQGYKTVYFPTIKIIPIEFEYNEIFDWLIFISPQAVYHGIKFKFPPETQIAAIGRATAEALTEVFHPVTVFPESDWSSEGLLKLEEFQQCEGKKIGIVKGEGGRDWLASALTQRGAWVKEINVYQRALPEINAKPFLELVRQKALDVIICTSNEGLENLKKLLEFAWSELKLIPLIVISQRMKLRADELGFNTSMVAKNPSQEAILQTLEKVKLMENQTIPKTRPVGKWLVLIISVIALVAFLYLLTHLLLMNRQQLKKIEVAQTQNQKTIEESLATLHRLTEEFQSQQQVINALRQTQSGYNRDEWRVVQAEFLVKLANDKLQFENNVTQAVQLLQLADQEIRNSNDVKLMEIRKTLAQDIATLQAIPPVDVSGLYARLSALNQEVNKMPLPNKPVVQNESLQVNENLPWWKQGLHQTWQGLKQIVVVRYNEKGKLPLAAPDVQEFIYQNVHAALEKAMWALLHKNPNIYKASLHQAADWIRNYFVVDSPITQSVLTNLNQLEQIDLKPNLPNLAESLQGFQAYFAARNSSIEPLSPEVSR